MTKQLEADFKHTIENLVKKISNEQRIRRILTISLAVDICLTLGLGYFGYRTNQNSNLLAKQNSAVVVKTCEAINITNAAQLKLWGYLFSLPPTTTTTQTDEQKAQAAKQLTDFKTYISTVFAPRKC